jgi:cytochrome c oxidase assembly protein subunit 15
MDSSFQNINIRISIWLFTISFLIIVMIFIGGATRLTGSGLSMVEWRPFLGFLPPLTDTEWIRIFELYKLSPEFTQINFWMGLSDFKFIFFWEYFHRVWGRLIGLFFLVPFIYFLYTKRLSGVTLFRTFLIFSLICIQGIIGWWMVKSGLNEIPTVSQYRLSIHLSMAFIILGLSFWTALDLYEGPVKKINFLDKIPIIFISLTIIAGTFVSGMDAGLVYNSFPYMGEGIVPIEYGSLGIIDPFENPVSAQFHHRLLATLTLVIIILYFINYVLKNEINQRIIILSLAIIWQFIIGIFTLLYSVPILLGVIHQFGGVLLFLSSLWLLHLPKFNFNSN